MLFYSLSKDKYLDMKYTCLNRKPQLGIFKGNYFIYYMYVLIFGTEYK